MKSMSASSASLASLRQSGQLADQRSGTLVAERPDEQLAPNRPSFSALALYIATRSFIDSVGRSSKGRPPAFLSSYTNAGSPRTKALRGTAFPVALAMRSAEQTQLPFRGGRARLGRVDRIPRPTISAVRPPRY